MINEIFLLRSAKQYCTYADFPASVREEVQTAWNDWLGTRGERIVDFDQAGSEGRLLFFQEMQSRNFKRMYRFLREELGVKSPIATTSCYVGPAMLPLALDGDYTEGHAYFSHPQAAVVDGRNMRALFARPGFYGGNYLTLIPFALSQRIGYQPYVVGEWNSCVPERFDLPLLMSAFANIQDIDGAFLFQLLQCGWEDAAARSIDTFGTIGDPGILVNMIPAALAWHRGYVPRAAMAPTARAAVETTAMAASPLTRLFSLSRRRRNAVSITSGREKARGDCPVATATAIAANETCESPSPIMAYFFRTKETPRSEAQTERRTPTISALAKILPVKRIFR